MGQIVTALQGYTADQAADQRKLPVLPRGPVARLVPFLEPTYIRSLRRIDPWQNAYEVESDGEHYTLRTRGRCGESDVATPEDYARGEVRAMTDDLVVRDGQWMRGLSAWLESPPASH